MANDSSMSNAVAIVGIGLRLPGANGVEQFWNNLREGVDSIAHFSDAELEDSFGEAVRTAPNFVRARSILDDVDLFDADFFGMHAREAALTDPQHRVFLECAWQALEDGACDPQRYRGAIGVFAGSSMNTYFLRHVCADPRVSESFTSNYQLGDYTTLLGTLQDFLATRVSYKLDLKGPSMTLQSACSTSLLAVAQACQSLQLYQCDAALAGGVSITFPQKRGYLHVEGGMASADGRCRTFDAQSSGTVFGSGCGVVMLKRLDDALRENDRIYAVIRGCGVNNDGAGKVGFTAPSVDGQAGAIEMALAAADVEPQSIAYVECHGTATPLGDPIEVAGLSKAFAAAAGGTGFDRKFCALGSVKSNIGHLDAAAGVSGLIKAALSLHHEQLPASLHFEKPNPQIEFESSPFYVNARLAPWPRGEAPRRAGVSAFGVGGTNVHVVLEEAPRVAAVAPPDRSRASQLLLLSARTPAALQAARLQLAAHLRRHPEQNLADLAYGLQTGRRAFAQRYALVCHDHADAIAKLEGGAGHSGVAQDDAALAFMFPGQGAQYPQMGRGLYDSEPVFRTALDRCADILQPMLDIDLRELLYRWPDAEDAAQRLKMTRIAQPAIFAVEYATALLWFSWGLRPQAMIGHSLGEFVSAVLAGVFSLEDALSLVAARGQLMQALPPGAMLAVRLPEAEVAPLLNDALAIAAINAPTLSVVSGPENEIAALETLLTARGVSHRRLQTSHAFHSPMVEPIVRPLRDWMLAMPLSAPTIPYVSCVSGSWVSSEQAMSPDYWAAHARQSVRFADGIACLTAERAPLLLEVGPGNTLSMLAMQTIRQRELTVTASLPDAARETPDRDVMLEALGRLWIAGAEPDWLALHGAPRPRVSLPGYPFERRRYWIDAIRAPSGAAVTTASPSQENESTDPGMNTQITAAPAAPMPAPADNNAERARALVLTLLEELSGESQAAASTQSSFLELGFDSLFLSQLAQRVQQQCKLKLTFRQLLGEFSTIAKLSAFLADKLPPSAAPAPAPAAAAVATASVMPAAGATLPANSTIDGILREQLQSMSQLINRQLEALQAIAGQRSVAQPASIASTAPPQTQAAAPEPDAAPQAAARFKLYQPSQATLDTRLTPQQQQHLAELQARADARTANSKRLTQQFRPVLADPRAAAGFRSEWKELVYPLVCTRSAGSKIWDVDGNEYIDLVNGYGQTAFGHAPDFVVSAVKAQLDKGFAIGPQAELAGEVAALFCELTGNERMTYCNTGSEAVMAAMRLARAVTGRDKVAMFTGDYHGQFDEVLVKGLQRPGAAPRSLPVATGIPAAAVSNMIVLEYGTDASLQWLREHAEELAAVIVEPVQSRHPDFLPLEFLRELRRLTEASGTALVMDEVVTGFRTHPGGIQALTGIRGDLATYGKVVGGGLPIGILAGKARFMDALDGGQWQFGDDSFPQVGVTFFAGTFVRHPLVLAACRAVLEHIKHHGPALQEMLAARTAQLVAKLQAEFAAYGSPVHIEHFSSWFYFNIHNEHPLAGLLFHHLREQGIHAQDGFPCFLTTAHSDEDLQRIVAAFRAALAQLSEAGIIGKRQDVPAASVPLTESQKEIWMLAQQGDAASCTFNESVTLHLQGRLDEDALQTALQQLVARRDALRASFGTTGEQMVIAPALTLSYPVSDLSDRSEAQAQEMLDSLIAEDAATPFDLVNGPLIRVRLLQRSAQRHELLLTVHHIICDGWSVNILVEELAELYAAQLRHVPAALPAPQSFADYARAQQQGEPAQREAMKAYWLQQFAALPPALELPTDRPRAAIRTFKGATRSRHLNAALYKAVKETGARRGCTLFVSLLAAYQLLLGRLAAGEDIVVGIPTAGQSLLDEQNLVGHCVHFLPIRSRWSGSTRCGEFLATLQKTVLAAQEHQDYTLGTLVDDLKLKRQASRVPLTQVQFNLERLSDSLHAGALDIEVEPNAKACVNFDLFMNVIESERGLRIDCDYSSELFDAQTVDRWLACYETLLRAMTGDASQVLTQLPYLPAELRETVLTEWNRSEAEYCRDKCAQQLFELQAAATPNAPAVEWRHQSVSYAELDRRANQLAHYLLRKLPAAEGAGPRRVAILMQRSPELLVALLAAMKAGLAYVPLDPAHPPVRLRHILADATPAMVISDLDDAASLVGGALPIVHPQREAADIIAEPRTAPAVELSPERLAYLIYTSGSTGQPKGVEISHRALVNLLSSMAKRPGLTRKDVMFAVTTVSFDIAALELLLPLVVGAEVVMASHDVAADGLGLLEELRACGANVMQATPSGWRLLLEAGFRAPAGFKMLCGGEALTRELADRLLEGSGELWNLYGPTETTIWSSCARVLPGNRPITAGRPIANTQLYILDRYDQPVPPGVPGQLHIGGDGVALGYHGQPAMTTEKFIANPFAAGRLYRSGDWARQLADGELQILGRMDHQIKLRGFRIELGEIEAQLLACGGLANATVLLREDEPDQPRLVAYYVEKPGEPRSPAQLRAALQPVLPDYMMPSAWLRLDALPLTANGKLDRAALPVPDAAAATPRQLVPPHNALEATLLKIWSEVLKSEQLSTTDDLLDLGADSIQLFQMAARANREGLRLTAKQLLRHRNIGELAQALERSEPAAAPRSAKRENKLEEAVTG